MDQAVNRHTWRRTPGGFLLEAALLGLLFWLPAILSGDISLVVPMSAFYLLWTTGSAVWAARIGTGPSVGFTTLYLAGSFTLALSLHAFPGLMAADLVSLEPPYSESYASPRQWDPSSAAPNPSSAADQIMDSGKQFITALVLVWLATICLPRPQVDSRWMMPGLVLPEAMIAGFVVAAVPLNGMALIMEKLFQLIMNLAVNLAPTEARHGVESVNAIVTWAEAGPWSWSLPFGVILFVAHERALTAALSRLYGSGETEPLHGRALLPVWLVAALSIVAVLWIYKFSH